MNRRQLLLGIVAAGVSGAAGFGVGRYYSTPAVGRLHAQLSPLYDFHFADIALKSDAGELLSFLISMNVVTEKGDVDLERLDALSATDARVIYKRQRYLKSELALYSLAYLLGSSRVTFLPGIDLYGADIDRLQVEDAAGCAAACDADRACREFTYAEPTHEIEKKHNMCWLKGEGTKLGVADHYVSGMK